jgi:CubicO group peptidase (beta-lactamase class C family)
MTILSHYFDATGPGAALAVVFHEKPPETACVGLADLQRKTKITADTVFELASASKMFTATGIMFQVEQGCLDLSAPVSEYMPDIDKPATGREITIRDLLWHTSGLHGHGGSWVNSTILIGRYEKQRTSVIVLSNEVAAPVERISQRALALTGR